MTAPRHRWSFGLRTFLLVITIIAGPLAWVGYSVHWIRQRHEFLEHHIAVREKYDLNDERIQPKAPCGLWLLGEEGIPEIWTTTSHSAKAKRLFPEAEIGPRFFETDIRP